VTGKVKAFEALGVTLKNDRWSWSGRTPDGKTVVLQLWKDRLNYKTKPISYNDFDDPTLPTWINRPGNKDRIEDLKWARAHCEGTFRVVIGVAKDIHANPRETIEAYHRGDLIMKIVEFNEETGEFRAEMVEGITVPRA
jgi:hypothetical protein